MAYLFLMLGVSLLLPLLRLAFRLRLGLPMLFALGMLTVCHGWYQAHTALADRDLPGPGGACGPLLGGDLPPLGGGNGGRCAG